MALRCKYRGYIPLTPSTNVWHMLCGSGGVMHDNWADMKSAISRRAFVKGGLTAGAATLGAGMASSSIFADDQEDHGQSLSKGDAALLRFAAVCQKLRELESFAGYDRLRAAMARATARFAFISAARMSLSHRSWCRVAGGRSGRKHPQLTSRRTPKPHLQVRPPGWTTSTRSPSRKKCTSIFSVLAFFAVESIVA